MTLVTLRPDHVVQNSGASIGAGSGTLASVLADDNDATYIWPGTSSSNFAVIGFPAPTLPAGAVIKSGAGRARIANVSGGSMLGAFRANSYRGADSFGEWEGSITWSTPTTISAGVTPLTVLPSAPEIIIWGSLTGGSSPRAYELYIDLVYVTKPVTTVVGPTASPVPTSWPTIEWSNTLDTDGGDQTAFEVKIFSAAQYGASNFSPDASTPYSTSGVATSSSTSWTDNSTATPDGTIQSQPLADGTYRAYVRVAQTVNGTYTWSAWATKDFTVTAVKPNNPTVVAYSEPDKARIRVDVVDLLTDSGTQAQYFEIERSTDGGASWAALRTVHDNNQFNIDKQDTDDTRTWNSTGTLGSNAIAWSQNVHVYSGAFSRHLTAANSTAANQAAGRMQQAIAVAPGDTVAAPGAVYNAGTMDVVRVRPRFFAADGTTLVAYGTDLETSTKGAFVELEGTWTVPAGAAFARLEVYALSSASGQTVDVYWESTPLVISDHPYPLAGAVLYDYEAPNGTAVSYRARAANTTTSAPIILYSDWVTATATWSADQAWVKHPLLPALNAPVTVKSFGAAKRAGRQGVFQALGATDAIVVSDTRGPRTGQLVLMCDTDSERAAIDALLDTNAVLLLQVPSGWAHVPDAALYLTVGDQDRAPVVDNANLPKTLDTLTWTQVPAPTGALIDDEAQVQ